MVDVEMNTSRDEQGSKIPDLFSKMDDLYHEMVFYLIYLIYLFVYLKKKTFSVGNMNYKKCQLFIGLQRESSLGRQWHFD